MSARKVTIEELRRFTPLDGLKRENIAALVSKVEVQELVSGAQLFSAGESEKRTYYLLAGSLELADNQGGKLTIRAGSEPARNPIAPMLPRRFTATALDSCEYIAIDTDLLDVMLTWDQTGDYEVSELTLSQPANPDDWMGIVLRTKAFHSIPPQNIQAIFMRMQRVNYSAGDIIIQQGQEGDYFFVVISGSCNVTRETPLNQEGIKLAELEVGDTFGEEALISENRRNATVTMLTDGSVMRLGKKDFNTLLNEPLTDWIDYESAKEEVSKGATWLDVRLPSEFEANHEPDAINIPLYFIRLKADALDPEGSYIVCCDTGRRSSAAAFILNERGLKTKVLKGGLHMSGLN